MLSATQSPNRIAVSDPRGALTYSELDALADRVARRLLGDAGSRDLNEARIAFLVTPSTDWVLAQRGIWRAGGIAVPLCISHPLPELEYVLRDAEAARVVFSADRAPAAREAAAAAGIAAVAIEELRSATDDPASLPSLPPLPSLSPDRRAQILYTSGTTGRPKGVVATHRNLEAQVTALVEAWGWRSRDRTVNVLPLHHLHGIINVIGCALACGAHCELPAGFDAEATWRRLASGEITVFMAVPTIYSKLLGAWSAAPKVLQDEWSAGAERLRLMVSGSAALPVRVLEEWQRVSGHRLLERYGMTETGMILSNPLDGERVAGAVGAPVPGIEVRFADGGERDPQSPAVEGELEVRGPAVFSEYWRRPAETREVFADGWFKTGDRARLEDGRFRLLGRSSVDILKTGGYKVSALEIEEVLRSHPKIRECAVVGIADEEWGQRVAAAVVPRDDGGDTDDGGDDGKLSLEALRAWGKERLAPYKVPTMLLLVGELPRNAMGKVTKPEVAKLFR